MVRTDDFLPDSNSNTYIFFILPRNLVFLPWTLRKEVSESGILEKWSTDIHFEKNLRRTQQRDQPRKKDRFRNEPFPRSLRVEVFS